MFYLIGIGLKPAHLTLEAVEAIAKCSRVFLDNYTSAYAEGSAKDLAEAVGKPVLPLGRKAVEEGFSSILKNAKSKKESVALLVFGNALSATTHVQLLLDAKRLGLEAKVIPGISIFNELASTGLDQYRFGRTCTIVEPKQNYAPESFYDTVERNLESRLHTLCLLDIDAESSSMLSVPQALSILRKIEKGRGKAILEKAVFVGLYGLGSRNSRVRKGSLKELERTSYPLFPQSLVIAAQLTEKEQEALEALGSG